MMSKYTELQVRFLLGKSNGSGRFTQGKTTHTSCQLPTLVTKLVIKKNSANSCARKYLLIESLCYRFSH